MDDVEYGVRNIKHLVLMNGICVWHEPFEHKYASSLEYYNVRNRLVNCALHSNAYHALTLQTADAGVFVCGRLLITVIKMWICTCAASRIF